MRNVKDIIRVTVAMVFILGVTPRRMEENTKMGRVVFGPATKKAMIKSSKLKVKASKKPATMAGKSWGRVT